MTTAEVAPVKNLRETRREMRSTKRGAAARALGVVKDIDDLEAEDTTPAKTPAKKAAPKPKAEPKAKEPKPPAEPKVIEGKSVYTATGRGGKVNRRNFSTPMTHAVDVADPNAHSEAAKAGLIYRFFVSEEAAEQWAAKKRGEGYDAIVVPAKPYTP